MLRSVKAASHPYLFIPKDKLSLLVEKHNSGVFPQLSDPAKILHLRSYSRRVDTGEEEGSFLSAYRRETWRETILRCVNGTCSIYEEWKKKYGINQVDDFSFEIEEFSILMYEKMSKMHSLPPGRGLWTLGTKILEMNDEISTENRIDCSGRGMAINSCGFVSTCDIGEWMKVGDYEDPFSFLMNSSMLGVGIGFDTEGRGKLYIKGIDKTKPPKIFKIHDSREGWVISVRLLMDSYIFSNEEIQFDYSGIRKKGELLKRFGGISSGKDPLEKLHKSLRIILGKKERSFLQSIDIVDIFNLIGVCVVSGNIRRTAEVALGDPKDESFVSCKDRNLESNSYRLDFMHTSNNSIVCQNNDFFSDSILNNTKDFGEPGFLFIQNAREYGRMGDPRNFKDKEAQGCNPCLEQTLENREVCCLSDVFLDKIVNFEEFIQALKVSFCYAKLVTLISTGDARTDTIVQRNRRVGVSLSGVAIFLETHGKDTLCSWMDEGYAFLQKLDTDFSAHLGVNRSIKCTSIKPGGSLPILVGSTSGIHFPISEYYIRRIIIANKELIKILNEHGYYSETSFTDPNAEAVEFPMHTKSPKYVSTATMEEQLDLARIAQKHWADNQVSVTIYLDKDLTTDAFRLVLSDCASKMKAVSFLPRETKHYPQMPFEKITKERYFEMKSKITPIPEEKFYGTFSVNQVDSLPDTYCETDSCEIRSSME